MKKKRCTGAKKACEKQRYEEIYKEATDAFLGELVEELEAQGLLENAVLVASGDHGEGNGEHGLYVHDNVYFEEGLHVPAVVVAPGLVPPGIVNSEPRTLLDLFPTVLELLDIDFDHRSLDGFSLLQAQPQNAKRYFRCWYDEYCQGYVQGASKVVAVPQEDTFFRFDLTRDPGEVSPLAEENELVPDVDELQDWMAARRDLVRDLEYQPKRLFDVWDCKDKRGRCTLDPEAYSKYVQQRYEIASGDGLWGSYFSDQGFATLAFERLDPIIDFNWPGKTTPGKGMPKEKYSVRWTGCIEVEEGEAPRLVIGADDGMKAWIDDRINVDNGGKHNFRWGYAARPLTPGIHRIRIEYTQESRDAQAVLGWIANKEQVLPTVVPPDRLMPPGDSAESLCPALAPF